MSDVYGASRSWRDRVMDVRVSVRGSLQQLKAVRAALSGRPLRLLSLHRGESPPQPLY